MTKIFVSLEMTIILEITQHVIMVSVFKIPSATRLILRNGELPTPRDYLNRISNFLRANGCTQQNIGEVLDYSQSYISEILNVPREKKFLLN